MRRTVRSDSELRTVVRAAAAAAVRDGLILAAESAAVERRAVADVRNGGTVHVGAVTVAPSPAYLDQCRAAAYRLRFADLTRRAAAGDGWANLQLMGE